MAFDTDPVLITGAGKRVGKHLALSLARHGHPVAVHYNRSAAEAEAVCKTIRAHGGGAVSIGADLSEESAVSNLWDRASTAMGRPIALLVNNASLFQYDEAPNAQKVHWDRHLSINAWAPLSLIQQMAKGIPSEQKGVAVNIIDQRVWRLTPDFLTYTVSKSALWTLTQTLAQALAPRIRVMGIGPGPVLASIHQGAEIFQKEERSIPLQKGPDLDELANAVHFIFDTPSLTGQMLALDGGQHLAWQTPDVAAGRRYD